MLCIEQRLFPDLAQLAIGVFWLFLESFVSQKIKVLKKIYIYIYIYINIYAGNLKFILNNKAYRVCLLSTILVIYESNENLHRMNFIACYKFFITEELYYFFSCSIWLQQAEIVNSLQIIQKRNYVH